VQRVNGYGPVPLYNQNEQFLTTVPGALAAKTGYTDAAQHTFVGAVSRHGRRLGVVFLRGQRWPSDQWQQATDLMNWGFALPSSTAPVGHLDSPLVATPAARHVAAAPLPAGVTAHDPQGWWFAVGGLVLIAAAASWRIRRAFAR